MSNQTADTLFDYLRDVLYYPKRASLDVELLPEDFRQLGEGIRYFAEMIGEVRGLASNLSRGLLDVELPPQSNELASNLKALHATLKHLTWQTQRVAEGDYNQHISFMGEFAEAFNSMILQLKERQEKLQREMDIIQQKTQELSRSNALFESVTNMMTEWIVLIDRKTGEHLYSNHPLENYLATPIFEPQLDKILFEYAQKIDDDAETVEPIEAAFPLLSDFAVQWFDLILYPMEWYGHAAAAAVLTDITADRAQLQELENVAYKDMLTGAYNRHFGMKLLNDWLEQRKHFVIAFIDMDRLKYVNDVFGHAEGDRYILKVAETLGMFSPIAQVCRLGGDEFMVLATDMTRQGAEARLELLRSGMVSEEYISEDGETRYRRSVSYGVVEVAEDNETPSSDLLATADERMYEYKRAHKSERRE